MAYTMDYLECGKYKFRVGENGVKGIFLSKEMPGIWIVEFDNKNRTILAPTETVRIDESYSAIEVPNVIEMPDAAKAS